MLFTLTHRIIVSNESTGTYLDVNSSLKFQTNIPILSLPHIAIALIQCE